MGNGYFRTTETYKQSKSNKDLVYNYVDHVRVTTNRVEDLDQPPPSGYGWRHKKSIIHLDLATSCQNTQSEHYLSKNFEKNFQDLRDQLDKEKKLINQNETLLKDDCFCNTTKSVPEAILHDFDFMNEPYSLRRTRSLSVIHGETSLDDSLQLTSNGGPRRSQLIPRARLYTRETNTNKHNKFLHKNISYQTDLNHKSQRDMEAYAGGLHKYFDDIDLQINPHPNLYQQHQHQHQHRHHHHHHKLCLQYKSQQHLQNEASHYNDKSDLESLNSDYFKNSRHQQQLPQQHGNQLTLTRLEKTVNLYAAKKLPRIYQSKRRQQKIQLQKRRKFYQQQQLHHQHMNECESCSEGSQSSLILETTTSHFEDYTTSTPSEQEEYDIARIDRFYQHRYFQNAAEYLDDDETNYELISLTTNTHTQHCKTETEETETDTCESDNKTTNRKLINYDSVYLSSEEGTGTNTGTDELSKQAETVKDTQLLLSSPLNKKKCTVMSDYNEATINLVTPLHTSESPNLKENQYFSLPDVSIGRSLKVSECIDDDLRSSYNCIQYTGKRDYIYCRDRSKPAFQDGEQQITTIRINQDNVVNDEKMVVDEEVKKQVVYKKNARSLSLPKISTQIQCGHECFASDNAKKGSIMHVCNAKAIKRHSSLYDKATNKEAKLMMEERPPLNGSIKMLQKPQEIATRVKHKKQTESEHCLMLQNATLLEEIKIVQMEQMKLKQAKAKLNRRESVTEREKTEGENLEQIKEKMELKQTRDNIERKESMEQMKMKPTKVMIERKESMKEKPQHGNLVTTKEQIKKKQTKVMIERKESMKENPKNGNLVTTKEQMKMKPAQVMVDKRESMEKKHKNLVTTKEQMKLKQTKVNIERRESMKNTQNNTCSETSKEQMKLKQANASIDKCNSMQKKQEQVEVDHKNKNLEQIKVKKTAFNVTTDGSMKKEKTDLEMAVEQMKMRKQQQQQQLQVKQMKIVEEKETHEFLNTRPKTTVTTMTTTTTTTTLVKSNSPVIVNIDNQQSLQQQQQQQQEFDHIRYKVLKSEQFVCTNVLSKLPISNKQGPTQLDELLRQYLKEYSFHELFKQNNNVVIVEPVRSTISCPFVKHMKRLEADKQQNATNMNCNRLKKHFFLQPIRVNRELYENELPNPDTVRKVRKFFEERQIIMRGKSLNNALENIKYKPFKDNHALSVEQQDMEQTECILTAITSAPQRTTEAETATAKATQIPEGLNYLHLTNGKFGYNFSKQIEHNRVACVRVQDVIKRHNRIKSDASSLQESLTTTSITSTECKQNTKEFKALSVEEHTKCKNVVNTREHKEDKVEKPHMEVTTIEGHLGKNWSIIDETLKRHYVSNDKLYGNKKYDDIEFEEYEIYKQQQQEQLSNQENALHDVTSSAHTKYDKNVDMNQHQLGVSANKIDNVDDNDKNTSKTISTYDNICLSKEEVPAKAQEPEVLFYEPETIQPETDCYDSLD